MTNAKISIITPVWNGLPYLMECVNSVIMQQFKDWEMLISDDGSTDGSRDYLASLNDSRIKVYEQGKNQGIFGNLNFLIDHVKAPVCQILCQDDYFITSTALDVLLSYWDLNPDVGFVRFNQDEVSQCRLTAFSKKLAIRYINPGESDLYFYIFGNLPGNLSNVSLRTEIVAACGMFDQSLPYAGDFEFWSRAARTYTMGIENTMITHVRRHDGVASIHLNRKGELLAQQGAIFNTLFQGIVRKKPVLKTLLQVHGVLNFDSLQRDNAVRTFLRGKPVFIRELNRVSKKAGFMLKPIWYWPIFILSAGGRLGRVTFAKRLLGYAD